MQWPCPCSRASTGFCGESGVWICCTRGREAKVGSLGGGCSWGSPEEDCSGGGCLGSCFNDGR
eukprot:5567271-Karenia_brevis.AAC.1